MYRHILRVIIVVTWLISLGAYLVLMSGFLPVFMGIVRDMPAVRNGPFWGLLLQFKQLASVLLPAVILVGPLLYWVVTGVTHESQVRRVQQP